MIANIKYKPNNRNEKIYPVYKNQVFSVLETKIKEILNKEIKNIQLFRLLCHKLDNLLELCILFQVPQDCFEIDMSLLLSNHLNYATGLIFAV